MPGHATAAAGALQQAAHSTRSWWVPLFMVAQSIFLAICIGAITLILLPQDLVSKLGPLKKVRTAMIGELRRMLVLSLQGPFVRIPVRAVKAAVPPSILVSKVQTPKSLKATAVSTTEIHIRWQPVFPLNPAHDEWYRLARSTDGENWKELRMLFFERLEVKKKDSVAQTIAQANPPVRYKLADLPPATNYKMRICAENDRGRSAWTSEIIVSTMAAPNSESGFTGPLASGAPPGKAGPIYHWFQSKHEVGVRVPIANEWKAKDMKVVAFPTRIEIRHENKAGSDSGEDVRSLLRGTLGGKIKSDEVFWELCETDEEGRHIAVTLRKADLMEKWASFLDGDEHPRIDASLIKLHTDGNAWNELSSLDLWE